MRARQLAPWIVCETERVGRSRFGWAHGPGTSDAGLRAAASVVAAPPHVAASARVLERPLPQRRGLDEARTAARHRRACDLCRGQPAAMLIETARARITSIHADPDDPLSQVTSVRKPTRSGRVRDPDRLRRPHSCARARRGARSRGTKALTAAAQGLHQVQKRHSEGAVATSATRRCTTWRR